MKRFITICLALSFMLCLVLSPAYAADGETVTRDAFVFRRLVNGNLQLVDYNDKESEAAINIPSTVDGQQVERIGGYAFADCKAKNITIPSTVKVIETGAFDNCTGIEKISIPNEVFFLDGNPFTGCVNLVNISLDPKHPTLQVASDGVLYSKRNKMLLCYPCSKPDLSFAVKPGTMTIGKNAFYGCDRLQSVTLPDTVTEIYESAFMGCKNLKSISFPSSLLTIEQLAFSGCVSLSAVRIPENVSRIAKSTFFNCPSLAKVSLPQNMTDIDDMAFFGCTARPEIRLPKNLSRIGEKAFSGCASLTDAYVPVSVIRIGDAAFEKCNIRLYLHLDEYSFSEIYAKIWDISYTYDTEDSFLSE